MEDKNYTIIEDIFNLDDSDDNNHFNNMKTKISFNRTLDSHSARPPYPSSNIPSLSYDEDMIKNKLSRQINPRVLASQYNSMSNTNRILQPPQPQQLQQQVQPQVSSPPQQTNIPLVSSSTPSAILRTTFYNPPPPQEYDEEVDQQEEYNQGNLELPQQQGERIYDILDKTVEPLSGINFSEYQRIKSNIKIVVPQLKEPKPEPKEPKERSQEKSLKPDSRAAKYLAKPKGGYDSDE